MKLEYAQQIDVEDISNVQFDLLIASSGFEKRAPHFFQNFAIDDTMAEKWVFCYRDRDIYEVEENIDAFLSMGFKVFDAYENSHLEMRQTLSNYLQNSRGKRVINLLIDYSCMTKVWYASVLQYLNDLQTSDYEEVNIFFAYTEAQFEEPSSANPSYSASLMNGFHALESPHKRVAMLIGLGYEENRALGLIEYLHIDFKNCYIFKTDEMSNPEFHAALKVNNASLLKRIPKDQVFEYPINDLAYLDSILSTLVNHLRSEERRVLIAPLGPKPFSLLTLLLATKDPFINVHRVSQTPKSTPATRLPNLNKSPILCKAIFK